VPAKPARNLEITLKPGESEARAHAEVVMGSEAVNAMTTMNFAAGAFSGAPVDINECVKVLSEQSRAVNGGDFTHGEAMLVGQAASLNAIFGECARRACLNMGQNLDATEAYMRMAMRAQSQCRATWETVGVLKNPPVVFAKQANFANGPQQVNNGAPPPHAHTAETVSPSNELLGLDHGERLDFGATGAASGADTVMATVGAIDRTDNGGGEAEGISKRRQGAPARAGASPGTARSVGRTPARPARDRGVK
jgi:hypothetical protein